MVSLIVLSFTYSYRSDAIGHKSKTAALAPSQQSNGNNDTEKRTIQKNSISNKSHAKIDKWIELHINIKFYIPFMAIDPITNRFISITLALIYMSTFNVIAVSSAHKNIAI